MNPRIGSLVLLVTLLSIAHPASAFNGKRSGFMLGVGVGPSVTSFSQELSYAGQNSGKSDNETDAGVGTDFRIGGGISNQFLLYYVNRVSWFSLTNALDQTVTIANSVGLLGASYYLKPDCPAVYFNGLIGTSGWNTPFESRSTGGTGFGVGIGAGYEFAKHWSVEGNVGFGSPHSEDNGFKLTTNATSFILSIHGIAY